MRYPSLFSGIEAATVAWESLGWEPAAFCEFDDFPSAVLRSHYPGVTNMGDITSVTEKDIMGLGHIDLVVFGSPCQDLSISGKREGLAGERSGLFSNAIRIIQWCRKHCGTRYALWENVPGAFSSNAGRDFAEVVGQMAGARVDVPKGKWKTSGVCVGRQGMVEWRVLDAQHFGVPQRRRRIFALADFGNWSGRPPILIEPEGLRGDFKKVKKTWNGYPAISGTLAANCGGLTRAAGQGNELDFCVPVSIRTAQTGSNGCGINDKVAYTLDGAQGQAVGIPQPSGAVRRLTPVECERLQGFPDGYTDILFNNKPASNARRYKALGNSMAVPVMRWIGERIDEQDIS